MLDQPGGPSLGGAAGVRTSALVALELRTRLRLSPAGRIVSEREPDSSHGPRFYLGGSPLGNVWAIHEDVPLDVARALEALAADEPPLATPDTVPRHAARYRALLGGDAPAHGGLAFVLAVAPRFDASVPLVRSGTPEGDRLLGSMATEGVPDALRSLGFTTTEDFWPPWCVALQDGDVGAITFSARRGDEGVEAGTITVPGLRRRGLATAATAGWAAHPDLRTLVRFYSTDASNLASRGVARRLKALFLGATFEVA